jgi:hypothetical protein
MNKNNVNSNESYLVVLGLCAYINRRRKQDISGFRELRDKHEGMF